MSDTPTIYTRAAVETRKEDDGPERRDVYLVASTDALDSHGTVLDQNSWRLDRFEPDGPILWDHESWRMPIGRAPAKVEDGRLIVGPVEFAPPEMNPEAERVRLALEGGFVRGVSVGFRPHSKRIEDDVLILGDCELFEVSVTPVQSNPEAIAEMRRRALGSTEPEAAASDDSPAAEAVDTTKEEDRMSDTIIRSLGAKDEGEAVEALNALRQRAALADKLEETIGKAGAEALGAIRGLQAASEQLVTVKAELDAMKAAEQKRAHDALVEDLTKAGKLAGPLLDWARKVDTATLRGFAEAAPPIVPGAGKPAVEEPKPSDGGGLTDYHRKLCKERGIDEAEFAAQLKRLNGGE